MIQRWLHKRSEKAGFTIVEVLIGAAILVLIFMILYRMNIAVTQKNLTGKLVLQMESLRAVSRIMHEIRQSSDFVRPHIGETTTFLLARDMVNQMLFLYLDEDKENSERFKKKLFRIRLYRDTHVGIHKPEEARVLVGSVQQITFTCLDPNTVQLNMVLANDREEFQSITRVGAMNLGDIE